MTKANMKTSDPEREAANSEIKYIESIYLSAGIITNIRSVYSIKGKCQYAC